jgi:hypothetical protein
VVMRTRVLTISGVTKRHSRANRTAYKVLNGISAAV